MPKQVYKMQKNPKNYFGNIFKIFVENRRFLKFEKSPIFKYFFKNVPKIIFRIFLHFRDLFWHIFIVLKGIVDSFNGLATVQSGIRGIL